MKIYLAGKMDAEHGAWRDAILGERYDGGSPSRPRPHWEHVYARMADADFLPSWPTDGNKFVLNLHEYVGPYRVTYARADVDGRKDQGYFHGSTWLGSHGEMEESEHWWITNQCMAAVGRADIVFAYINQPDCFGTLAEIGMARALGKFIYLVIQDGADWHWSDYWFIEALASGRAVRTKYDDNDAVLAGLDDKARIREHMKNALVAWTARPQPAIGLNGTAQVGGERAQIAQSFAQIARWTSDPRVRTEAQRMALKVAGS